MLESPSNNCRLCKVSFKIQFGNLGEHGYSSSENLFKLSKWKECFGVVLDEICRQVGLPLLQDSMKYSGRVCNPCGRKIRNSLASKTPLREVSPAKSRKSLAFSGENISSYDLMERENKMFSRLNVENLPNDSVKIVYLNQSGNVIVRIPRDSQTRTLVKNIASKKWREVSNAILKHEDIRPELNKGICKAISKEFDEYLKSECVGCVKPRRACWFLEQIIYGRGKNLLPCLV